mmetsp:Transcript_24912/g.48518  ORF Transcript_24912/g.48518 Transcript_24912/m.48518 type:complete len:202 (+) Transcript_24912:270-875(+)
MWWPARFRCMQETSLSPKMSSNSSRTSIHGIVQSLLPQRKSTGTLLAARLSNPDLKSSLQSGMLRKARRYDVSERLGFHKKRRMLSWQMSEKRSGSRTSSWNVPSRRPLRAARRIGWRQQHARQETMFNRTQPSRVRRQPKSSGAHGVSARCRRPPGAASSNRVTRSGLHLANSMATMPPMLNPRRLALVIPRKSKSPCSC